MTKPKLIKGTIEFRITQVTKSDEEAARVVAEWINSSFGYRFFNGNTELIVKAIDLPDVGLKGKNPMKFTAPEADEAPANDSDTEAEKE